MFEMLMWLYDSGKGKLTVPMLANAVIKGWISDDQKKEILSTKKQERTRRMRVDKIKAFFIMAFSVVFNWLGILAFPLFILLGCNIFDYYTGWGAAPKRNPGDDKPIKSYKSIRGIYKKVCMYILIILGWFVDVLVETTLIQLIPVKIPPVFAITITCWLIFNEIISILENMDDMGVAIPPFLLPILKKMKGQIEEKADT